MAKSKYDANLLFEYLKRRPSTSVTNIDGEFRTWTSMKEFASLIGASYDTVLKWSFSGLPMKWKYVGKACEVLGIEPYDLLMPDSKRVYRSLLVDFNELIKSGLSAKERNLETARLSRELLRWEVFFDRGKFPSDDELDELEEGDIQKTLVIYEKMREMNSGNSENSENSEKRGDSDDED